MKITIKVPNFVKSTEFFTAVTTMMISLGSAAAGATVAVRSVQAKYALIAEIEIAEAKLYYSRYYKDGDFADPVALAEAQGLGVAQALIDELGYVQESDDIDVVREMREMNAQEQAVLLDTVREIAQERNVEAPADSEAELSQTVSIFANREGDEPPGPEVPPPGVQPPTIISNTEFFENPYEYEQVTITYYAEDGILSDERDQPIVDADTLVGEDNLERFGSRSKDPNIVYVRNEQHRMEFEIVRSAGSYENEVAGLKHSDSGPRRFRGDHE